MDFQGHPEPRWQLVHPNSQDGFFELYPANPPQFLFRGQTRRHRPCLPTIVRGFPEATAANDLDDHHQATLVLNLARTTWFNLNLKETPPMHWMSKNRVVFDETAVAQHYELPRGTSISRNPSMSPLSLRLANSILPRRQETPRWIPPPRREGTIESPPHDHEPGAQGPPLPARRGCTRRTNAIVLERSEGSRLGVRR